MATPKYKKVFNQMLEENSFLFNEFKVTHKDYELGTISQEEFTDKGLPVIRVIRRYDNELCSKSENSKFGKFSLNLSDKFWEEVRMEFPKIDEIKNI